MRAALHLRGRPDRRRAARPMRALLLLAFLALAAALRLPTSGEIRNVAAALRGETPPDAGAAMAGARALFESSAAAELPSVL